MNLIKVCPTCGKRIRFPISQGKINVKCICGFNFIADPDDPKLYEKASFDLNSCNKKSKKYDHLANYSFKRKIKVFIPSMIEGLLNYKYKLQNFYLLTNFERFKVLLPFLIIILIIVILIILISALNKTEFIII
jgi:hypothetical protein